MALQVDPIEVRLEARYREYEIQMLRILLADQLHLEDLRVRIPVGENKPRSNGAGPNDDRDMRFVKPDDSRSVGNLQSLVVATLPLYLTLGQSPVVCSLA